MAHNEITALLSSKVHHLMKRRQKESSNKIIIIFLSLKGRAQFYGWHKLILKIILKEAHLIQWIKTEKEKKK